MTAPDQVTRVVVFTGGAVLEDACVELVRRLDADRKLELIAVYCEAARPGLGGIVHDLFRRRGVLAMPLMVQRLVRRSGKLILAPRMELERRRALRRVHGRLRFVPDLHAPAVATELAALKPEIGLVYGGPILRASLFELPALGTLGIHHGRLPDYRGKKTTFWALYHGETTVGVAIQRIGKGLDRGDVVRQGVLPVGRLPLPALTRRLETLGLDLYVQAIRAVADGTAEFTRQPAGNRPLFRDPRPTEVLRFWLRDLRRLMMGQAGASGVPEVRR